MNYPLISVIIPIYNVKNYLKNCVNSVIKQSYQNLEIILIDDGSTDGGEVLADKLKQKDSRIVVVHQKNQGLSGARNSGLKICKGELVTFIDSDDFVAPDFIQYLYDLKIKHNADMSICSHYLYISKQKTKIFRQSQDAVFTTEECLSNMLQEVDFTVSACGKLYPTAFFRNIKFPINKIHEDLGATYKLIMKSKSIAFGSQPKYYYVYRPSSITHNFNPQKFDIITLTDEMCDAILKTYPKLLPAVKKRRMHARFSVLRQLPARHPEEKPLVSYLKKHRNDILKNPLATRRDRFAIRALLISPSFFRFSWRLYARFFK